jgi:chromosomal replication initiator protein
MTRVSGTVWNDILGHFRVNHPQLVRGWFVDLEPTRLDGGVLRIRARNGAQLRYLEKHCRVAFIEAGQAATGRLVSVSFEASDEEDTEARSGGAYEPDEQIPLNPDFTFDDFIVGPCNRLAHAAAVAVAEAPGRCYNPLFVYGGVGLGKTHLLQAACRSILAGNAGARCRYISCETFVNHFIEAVENGSLHRFRYRYRHADILVIDDIQFLAERERSQEEFFHTFNTLHQSQRQIILSADCSPAGIPSLEERLVSRFNSGLVALMDRPCAETRMAIVRKKAKLRCIDVPEDVIRVIATRIDTNIRDLEGTLTKIDALSQAQSSPITLALARSALDEEPTRPIKIPTILEAVARRFDVKISDLQGRSRSRAVTHPRHVCMYLARQMTGKSLEEVGGYFGGRDHTTVLHAARSITQLVERDGRLRSLLDEIASEVKNGSS